MVLTNLLAKWDSFGKILVSTCDGAIRATCVRYCLFECPAFCRAPQKAVVNQHSATTTKPLEASGPEDSHGIISPKPPPLHAS